MNQQSLTEPERWLRAEREKKKGKNILASSEPGCHDEKVQP